MIRAAPAFVATGLLSAMLATPVSATLPVVDGVPVAPLRANCRLLLQALHGLKAPLPAATERDLKGLLADVSSNPDDIAEGIQKLLDPFCLVAVSINPESRVKVARGPAAADLRQNQAAIVLIKIHNEAGVTQALAVSGEQVRSREAPQGGQWLEATVHAAPPLAKTLGGHKVEYVILRLLAHEIGKREATLQFDVGQGTQDLGFRAEVPVLFRVRPAGDGAQ